MVGYRVFDNARLAAQGVLTHGLKHHSFNTWQMYWDRLGIKGLATHSAVKTTITKMVLPAVHYGPIHGVRR